jgi:hypothetical protein
LGVRIVRKKNPTYPDESGITASPKRGTFVTTNYLPTIRKDK